MDDNTENLNLIPTIKNKPAQVTSASQETYVLQSVRRIARANISPFFIVYNRDKL